MFWSDINSDRIYRASLNGAGATVLINSGLSVTCMVDYCTVKIILWSCFVADGLAWDWVNEKLYWADAGTNKIEVYDPANTNRRVLINTGSNTDPADIIVDPNNGYVIVNC